jgi:hypothetical protein
MLPRTPWHPIAAAVATLAIISLSPLAGAAAARLYAHAVGLGATGVVISGNIDRFLMTYEAIYTAVLNLTMIALTLLAARAFGGRPAEVLALKPPPEGKSAYTRAILVAIGATVIWFAPLLALAPDLVAKDFRPYAELMTRERSYLMPPNSCLLAPVAEEFLFRGFLFPALAKSRLGIAGAAIMSSAAWTALHVNRTDLAMVQLFAASLLLCWLLMKSGSLRIPILCHALFNAGVSVIVIGFGIPQ